MSVGSKKGGSPVARPALDLPPPYRLVTLREVGDAHAHACATAGEDGAGTLVYVGRFDLAEFAVVLEPDEPLVGARRAFYAGCVALGDALLTIAPPEKPIEFEWPGSIRVDGGLVGGARLGWPPAAAEDAVPDWLVFSAMIRTVSLGDEEPGVRPLSTALDEEGFDTQGSEFLVASFARHLMAAIDAWQEGGFVAIAKSYLPRLAVEPGVRREIDGNGDLIVRRVGGGVERRALLAALAAPDWLDPHGGGPRR
ncbi:MAG: biotin/lipoate--protein ligase family protein [Proteobacteria bacterium]|nr:biotin/lipoate--protein ligase family protein [Pseudomonadota bacterium]